MLKKYTFFLFLFFSFLSAISQNDTLQIKILKGQIIDSENKKPLSASHILNLNSVTGTITNDEGFFELTAKANDTVMVSYLGYSSIKIKVTNRKLLLTQAILKL